jgi:GLPGLI family protein
MNKRRVFYAVLMNLMTLAATAQGVYWESTVSGLPGQKQDRMDRSYYMPHMLKMVNGEDGSIAILRLDKELLIMADPKEKTYWQSTFAEMESMMKGVSSEMQAQMEQMKKELAEMPEEQRKMVEQMMGQSGMMTGKEPKVETVKTGETKSISGFSCTKHVVKMDGRETVTAWATRDVKEFTVMREDMELLARKMKKMMPQGMSEASGLMSGIDGFTIQTTTPEGWTTTVTKIEGRSTPTGEFDPPAGYRKVDPPTMEGARE